MKNKFLTFLTLFFCGISFSQEIKLDSLEIFVPEIIIKRDTIILPNIDEIIIKGKIKNSTDYRIKTYEYLQHIQKHFYKDFTDEKVKGEIKLHFLIGTDGATYNLHITQKLTKSSEELTKSVEAETRRSIHSVPYKSLKRKPFINPEGQKVRTMIYLTFVYDIEPYYRKKYVYPEYPDPANMK